MAIKLSKVLREGDALSLLKHTCRGFTVVYPLCSVLLSWTLLASALWSAY